MKPKNLLSKKPMLAALLAIVIGMILNAPIAVRGAKPKLAKAIQAVATERGDEKRVKEAFDKLPLYFIESEPGEGGQAGYYVQGKDKSLLFTPRGITVTLETVPKAETDLKAARAATMKENEAVEEDQPQRDIEAHRWIVQLDFLGANPQARLSGKEQTPARISYFTGSKAEWRTGLRTFSSIVYRDLWPGIDLVYSGTATQVKHEFIVHPGGDPRDIKLAWRGASSVTLNTDGQMEIATPISSFSDDKPYSYQETDGNRAEVKSAYQLEPVEEEGVQVFGFAVGEYDHDQTLVIDPAMIIYCGYIGGGYDDRANDVAVDSNGNAYIIGATYSDHTSSPISGNFPKTVGPDLTFNGGSDAFVAKIKADGSGLVYCGYIGGSGSEDGNGIAVDNYGRAYIVGTTSSTLPDTLGFDRTYNGKGDAFIARIHQAGLGLEICSYLGGSEDDFGTDIAVDGNYNIYVTGHTRSSNFPRVVGPDLTFNGPNNQDTDVFVAKVNNTGSALLYSGFIGGSSYEHGWGIAVDGAGNAYITGATSSSAAQGFPVYWGPDLSFNGGPGGDAFVARVNTSGQWLDYCGYIGGDQGDCGYGIAVNSQGEAYICGYTQSRESTFPVKVGPSTTFRGGGVGQFDAFVARLNSSGTGLIYCGYLGGSGDDTAYAIAVDNSGRAYVTGATKSNNFPVLGGPDSTYNDPPPPPNYQPNTDAFVSCVSANGASLLYSSYLGGVGNDYAFGIAVINGPPLRDVPYESAIIAGFTNATPANSFPVKTGPSLTYRGAGGKPGIPWGDAFVAKIGPVDLCPNACPAGR